MRANLWLDAKSTRLASCCGPALSIAVRDLLKEKSEGGRAVLGQASVARRARAAPRLQVLHTRPVRSSSFEGSKQMELGIAIAILVVWIVLQVWVLPRFGVRT